MSAYIQSTDHIDALVSLGINGPVSTPEVQLTVWDRDRASDYFYHNGEAIYVVPRAVDAIGQMLVNENYRSVNYRYSEDDTAPEYKHKPGRRLTTVEAFVAIDGYEYQACEHPEWDGSRAKAYCDYLRQRIARTLSGYDSAGTWSI